MNDPPSDTWRDEEHLMFILSKAARSRSDGYDVASSDGHDFLQFQQSGSTAWIAIVIFIEQLAARLISTVGFPSDGR